MNNQSQITVHNLAVHICILFSRFELSRGYLARGQSISRTNADYYATSTSTSRAPRTCFVSRPKHHVFCASLTAMSLRSLPRARIVLRSSYRPPPTYLTACLAQRAAREQRRYASNGDEKKQKTPFNVQVFESVTKRVEKEKARLEEHTVTHQRTAQGRFFGTLFGTTLPSTYPTSYR